MWVNFLICGFLRIATLYPCFSYILETHYFSEASLYFSTTTIAQPYQKSGLVGRMLIEHTSSFIISIRGRFIEN